MSAPMRKRKLQVRLGMPTDSVQARATPYPAHVVSQSSFNAAAATPQLPSATGNPAFFESAFSDYEAGKLNASEKDKLVMTIRDSMPLAERDEVDSLILEDAGKQLSLVLFPLCQSMHISPKAVKDMMEREFKKFYGHALVNDVADRFERMDVVDETTYANDGTSGDSVMRSAAGVRPTSLAGAVSDVEEVQAVDPAKKRAKTIPTNTVAQEVATHHAKRRQQKKGCRIATLRSKAAAEKWAELNGDS